MKFLVDAHLPPGLCGLLQAVGHEARHTRQLPAKNLTTDKVINTLSAKEKLVVISKDTDFYYCICCGKNLTSWCWFARATLASEN